MPAYADGGDILDVSRAAVLLDTNVLVAAFDQRDEHHGDALGFIENPSWWDITQWLVPVVAIVEAWGMLTRGGQRGAGIALLRWLRDPGNPVVVCRFALDAHQRNDEYHLQWIVEEHRVDVPDALLVTIADDISMQCELRPSLRVATFDMRDFPRLRRALAARVRIFNMHILDNEED